MRTCRTASRYSQTAARAGLCSGERCDTAASATSCITSFTACASPNRDAITRRSQRSLTARVGPQSGALGSAVSGSVVGRRLGSLMV